ncbi:hypothetical protein BMF94_3338 [Rhodotorula taiwanensis]|uniref:Uncharacterized protein n=1 Tax=Rhodotorula taiwanensis TaxID=741276 RepID=A0A2S5BAK8_9BASI|nr:hypothetical protein BMF94_3338 [Rhodotorula taiwanensis]
MLFVKQVPLLLFAYLVGVAAASSASEAASQAPGGDRKRVDLEKRSDCGPGQELIFRLNTKMICVGAKFYNDARNFSYFAVGAVLVGYVTNAITSAVGGTTVQHDEPKAQRRDLAALDSVPTHLAIGDEEVAVDIARVGDRYVVNFADFMTATAGTARLRTRDVLEDDPLAVNTITGGTISYFLDGALDTFTLDMSVPVDSTASTANATESGTHDLAKRNYNTVHTTYWAESGHQTTSLNYNDVHDLVWRTYHSLPSKVSQVCGYMANSGTWHGSFRHWIGDNGYSIGECWNERKY